MHTIFTNVGEQPDAIVIKNSSYPFIDENFFYLTGLEQGIYEGSLVFVYPDGGLDLVVPELEAESAKKAQASLHVYKGVSEYKEIIKKLGAPLKTVGVNFRGLSHQAYGKLVESFPHSKFVDVSSALMKARGVKDAAELQRIKAACRICDRVIEKIPSFLKEGVSEGEVAAEIDYLMQKNGADKAGFETISSFGVNTAEPHYSHGDTRLKAGDFVLCDFGACYQRYHSDITRTFVFGSASKTQKEMYEIVREAQQRGFDMIRAGVKAQEVHQVDALKRCE